MVMESTHSGNLVHSSGAVEKPLGNFGVENINLV